MSGRARRHASPLASIVLGIVRLARGRADGIRQFGATRDAFLASLAPLIAFPLVGGALMLLGGGGLGALSDLLATLCALLAPPVLSFEVGAAVGQGGGLAALRHRVQLVPVGHPGDRQRAAGGARHAVGAWPAACDGAGRRVARACLPTGCGCTGSWPAMVLVCRARGRRCWWSR